MKKLLRRFSYWVQSRRRGAELDEEIEFHRAMKQRDLERTGLTASAASARMAREMGSALLAREDSRGVWIWSWVDDLLLDINFAFRLMRKSPVFTTVAIAALALGIGASMVVLGFVNAIFLKPLPVADPDRVVQINWGGYGATVDTYEKLRDAGSASVRLALASGDTVSIATANNPELAYSVRVTGNYFDTLGVAAALGRTIALRDDAPGAPAVAVLSDRYWRRHYDADKSVLGKTFKILSTTYTVIGVAPVGFEGTRAFVQTDFWTPIHAGNHKALGGLMIGRLQPGVSAAQSQSQLNLAARRAELTEPLRIITVGKAELFEERGSTDVIQFAGFIIGIIGLILLIVCTNVASLLMARSAARNQEIGVRMAMGAGRSRLIRQMLTENIILSIFGGIAAIPVALAAFAAIGSAIVERLPTSFLSFDPALDWRFGVLAVLVSFLTTILFGLGPTLVSVRTGVVPALKDAGLTNGPQMTRLREWFIVAEIGMSTMLLLSAFLLVREITKLQRLDPGFDSSGVLTANLPFFAIEPSPLLPLDPLKFGPPAPDRAAFYEEMIRRLEFEPGVVAASLAERIPLSWRAPSISAMEQNNQSGNAPVLGNAVSPEHFRTLKIPLIAGRDFDASDRAGTPEVAIVNETLAHRFWPGESPLGKQLKFGPAKFAYWVEVVGVAADSKYGNVAETSKAMVYRPLSQDRKYVIDDEVEVLVRTSGEPMSALPAIQRVTHSLNSSLPVSNPMTLANAEESSRLAGTIAGVTAGILGAIALALAAIGIYGVIAYLVRQRIREIGIRLALGAKPSSIVILMTRQAMVWTGAGLALGLLLAFVVSRLGVSLIYPLRDGVDPVVCVAVSLSFALIAYVAAFIPARRASLIDPLKTLREE